MGIEGTPEQPQPLVWKEPKPTALTWTFSLLLIPTLLCLSIWFFCYPFVFRQFYKLSVGEEQMREASRVVGWLGGSAPVEDLAARLRGGALGEKEMAHFVDVRAWLLHAKTFAIVGSLALVIISFLARGRVSSFAEFLIAAGGRALLIFGALVLLGGVFALWDWKLFFAWIHYPFFGATSWKLPKASYTLQLFPTAYWRLMGIALALTPLVTLVAIVGGAWWVKRRLAQPASL